MRQLRLAIVLAATLALTAAACGDLAETTRALPRTGAGSFEVVCSYSHRLPDDPIVKFGLPGASHSHDFLGNTSTNASSNVGTLTGAPTTCNRPEDRSAYWVPTVLYHGVAVAPSKVHIYYNGNRRPDVRPLPFGLEIVAGDAHATGPQDTRIVAWQCSDAHGPQPSLALPPTCAAGTTLKMVIRFPGCWDGVHVSSPDHKSHMAYATGSAHDGPCPAGYPVPVVSVNAEFKYPISDGRGVLLSSGPAYTIHGDFFDAWDVATMQTLVADCVDTGVKCGGPH